MNYFIKMGNNFNILRFLAEYGLYKDNKKKDSLFFGKCNYFVN